MRILQLLLALCVSLPDEALIAQGQPAPAVPATGPTANELQPAGAAFARSDWRGAFDLYSALASKYPTHALTRFRIGVSLVELGRLAEGEASLRDGERLGMPAGNAAFRLAEALAEQGKADAAIVELQRAAAARAPLGVAAIVRDAHFASLKSHAKWTEVLDAFDAMARPCLHDPRAREFDFWIGDWDVRPTGQPPVGPAARNTVTLENNGCTVVEHWVSPSGSEGQSFNLFDRSIGQWRQTWVDNVGAQHDYRGGLVGKDMVYVGDTPAPGGALGRVPTKLTFFRVGADSVRQFSQQSADGGRTWSTAYDLMYVRRKGADAAPPAVVPLSGPDRAAILALDSTFVDAWRKDDTTRVLGVFAADAVLLPPGAPPVTGREAMRAYWWPNDGSHTRITAFTRSIVEIGGTKGSAFMRGTGTLSWSYHKQGQPAQAQSSQSTDLVLYGQDADGQWQIVRQMWSSLP